ncbi:hypothetical protein ZWY2020_016246 [Hordeum vulgare]|nr:hypothetical protein ZWY2020_016246 [Hordeum vulgare]
MVVAAYAAPASSEASLHPWQEVRLKHWWRSQPLPLLEEHRRRFASAALRQSLDFKARFAGKCFRCLSERHLLKHCSERVRCIRCKQTGHIARFCLSRASAPSQALPPALRAVQTGLLRQAIPQPPTAPHSCWPQLASATAVVAPTPPSMEYIPGAELRRPERSSCVINSTPEMESDASHLRRTALLAIARDRRIDINSALVAKAVEQECGLAIDVFQVAPAFPEDYLLRFNEPFQWDTALERGFLTIRGVTFNLRPWEPATEGRVRDLWFYCRLAIVGLDFHTWRLDVVRKLLRDSCHVDRLERQTERLHNAAAMYVWVWTWNPDGIPRSVDLTVLERTGDGRLRHQLPEGSPAEDGRRGPEGRALIHLLLTKDYTPLPPDMVETVEWPRISRYEVDLGTLDGRPAVRARSSCGWVRHTRRREDDAGDEGHDRQQRRRRGPRRRSLWQNVLSQTQCRDTSRFDPALRREHRRGDGRGKGVRESRHRAPSRSPSDEPRWGNSLSPPPGSRRADSESSFTAVPAGTLKRRGLRTASGAGSGTGQPAPLTAAPLGRAGDAEGSMAEMVAAALAACVGQRPRHSPSAGMRSCGDSRAAGPRVVQEVAISPLDEVLAAAAAANHGQQAPKIPRDAVQCRLQSQLHANAAIEEAMFHVG